MLEEWWRSGGELADISISSSFWFPAAARKLLSFVVEITGVPLSVAVGTIKFDDSEGCNADY